jgi:hypothetical protein
MQANDRFEVSEAMVKAAMNAGKCTGALAPNARAADVQRLISAALTEMSSCRRGPRYDHVVQTGIGPKKARILCADGQRGYFRVETEDGKPLVVHANEIQPFRGTPCR